MTASRARILIVAALALGVLGDWLLRAEAPRMGFAVWVFGIIAVALAMLPESPAHDPTRRREQRLVLGSAAVVAALVVLRDAATLYALNIFALAVVGAVIAWRAGGRSLAAIEPRDAVVGGIAMAATGVLGAPLLAARDAAAGPMPEERRRSLAGASVGALIAVPILLVVTALLASADPLFAGFLDTAEGWIDSRLGSHLLGIGVASWVTAGALRGTVMRVTGNGERIAPPGLIRFPTAAPLLGGLAVLLSAWIGLQVRVLLGGANYVVETAGVTFAEYARRGFFELIVVAGIVLGALLVADALLAKDDSTGRRSLRMFGAVLLGLVGLLLASATHRLALYVEHYGLTDDRVLALAVVAWVALVLGWFGWTVLRGVRERFAPGVLVLSAIWLATINGANPERWVVQVNIARAEAGKEFDVAYHARLSADALPALRSAEARLAAAQGAERGEALRSALDGEWAAREASAGDWRGLSIPGWRAIATRR